MNTIEMTLLIYIFLSIEFLAAKVAQLIGKLVSCLQIGPDGRSIYCYDIVSCCKK